MIGYLWALPTSLIGYVLSLASWHRSLRDGVLECMGGLCAKILKVLRINAITFGYVTLVRSASVLEQVRAHERVHTRQARRWGPFFVPAYLLAGAWQVIRGRHAYWDNPFEIEARDRQGV